MKNIIKNYLQYSKRIVIFGVSQWIAVALFVIALTATAIFTSNHIEQAESEILRNIISSSSTLAIAISGGYYAHSAYDNTIKQRVSNMNPSEDQEQDNG